PRGTHSRSEYFVFGVRPLHRGRGPWVGVGTRMCPGVPTRVGVVQWSRPDNGAAPSSSAMRTLVSRIAFDLKRARRASICSTMSSDIGVDAVDPAEHVREQESVMVGEMPVERSAQLILLF